MAEQALENGEEHKLVYLPPEEGFLGLPPEDACAPDKARVAVVPFGLERSVSYEGGTAKGPRAVLAASPNLEFFDEIFWSEPFREYGIATVAEPAIGGTLEQELDHLEGIVEAVLAEGKFPLTLGGEHSLTPGAIRPFARRHEQLTILQFDAHADLRDGYEGEHYSHASAMCRCLDHDNVRLVSVGIRNISAEEIPVLERNQNRIEIFWAKDMKKWSAEDVARAVGTGPVYITFDVDGFDSSLMPATGTPEPGGLFWHDVMDILQAVTAQAEIVGADVVELSPRAGLHACDFVAARLCYRIMNFAFVKPKA